MQIRKLAPGDRLLDYRILEKIGEGGFGEVFRAEHEVLGRIVAIKVPRDAEALSALRLEGVIQSTLDHPSIVRTLEISISHDPPYVVLEHVDGSSLAELLKREGPLPWKRGTRILVEAARALKHAHERGVVHGDVKPGNVLCENGEQGRVRLTDFGLGRVFEGPRGNVQISRSLELATSGAEVQGTLRYLAPEVQRGEPADERSDLYSWGVLLFEVLTGKLPEGREIPSDLAKGVPAELDDVFESCFQRRERRPRSLDAAIATLDRLLAGGPRPRAAGPEELPASTAIPFRGLSGPELARPLPASPRPPLQQLQALTAQGVLSPQQAQAIETFRAQVKAAGSQRVPEPVVSPDAQHVLRMLGGTAREGALPAVSAEPVSPASPPLDLGAAVASARGEAGFARWRDTVLATVRARFEGRPAGTALVPAEGFDLAVGVLTEGEPHHRIYTTLVPSADLELARRFVKGSKIVFEREKGVWEKEVTFVLVSRSVSERSQVLNVLRGFSNGWWRRRRAVLLDLSEGRLYSTELGCDPRGNPLKRIFFDALQEAARKAPATTSEVAFVRRTRGDGVRSGLVGVGLALVATGGLLFGAVCVDRAHHRMQRRRGPVPVLSKPVAPAPNMRAVPAAPLAPEAPLAPAPATLERVPEVTPWDAEAPKAPATPKAVEAPKAPEPPKAVEAPKAPEPPSAETPRAETPETPKAPEAPNRRIF